MRLRGLKGELTTVGEFSFNPIFRILSDKSNCRCVRFDRVAVESTKFADVGAVG